MTNVRFSMGNFAAKVHPKSLIKPCKLSCYDLFVFIYVTL